MNENSSSSVSIAESIGLWHGKLGYVNFASIQQLKNLRLILTVNVDNFSKCPMCVEVKHTKKPFKLVTSRKTELLELLNSNLVDFRTQLAKGEKSITSLLWMTALDNPNYTSLG